jgi:hypothetical protein
MQNPDMNEEQIPPGSGKGTRGTTSSTKPAEPTNSQLGEPTTDVTNPTDAREAHENGSVAGIGHYLYEVASLLKLISKHRERPQQKSTKPPGFDPDWEFEYDTEEMRSAIEAGSRELVDAYLREHGKLMTLLGDMLDPKGRSEFQLKPVRRRRGKPKDRERIFLEGKIHQDLRFARARLGKLEAAISEVGEKYKLSRSTVFRIWKRYERTRSRT